MKPAMTAVDSSNLKAIGYDAVSATLFVEFHNGKTYKYEGVGQDVYEGFRDAPSKGRHFHALIRTKFTGIEYVEPKQEDAAAPAAPASPASPA